MNATLQCFAHIHEFVIFLKKDDQVRKVINEKKEGTTNLTTVFAELLQNLYPTSLKDMKKEKYYALINFKETISQMNSLFKGIQATDSKDLVNFIIMQLHDELKKANPNKNNNNKFNFKIK
jgi:ubiquitin C-terminal hydrolase